ncbi:hypothetical protein pdam_00000544 [Pocillopora damicornis]|uniref:Uncharacterized protein n=1 Tax=Pocillopora damicornis TaxID=46731 RepID=A0A3M6TYJ7_POCDA|nr:hypothetical protein pdam_00000544 [Pocillopora damicornis]
MVELMNSFLVEEGEDLLTVGRISRMNVVLIVSAPALLSTPSQRCLPWIETEDSPTTHMAVE